MNTYRALPPCVWTLFIAAAFVIATSSNALGSERAKHGEEPKYGSSKSPAAGHGEQAAVGHKAPRGSKGGQNGAPHWSYEGKIGPEYWGGLADEFALCGTGESQSPVDFTPSFATRNGAIEFNYKEAPLRIVNNGHTIQVNYPRGSTISIDGHTYRLLQFHFHTPSEHTVGSHPYPMEAHLVHKDRQGKLAVVGVFLKEGKSNGLIKALWRHLPDRAGEKRTVKSRKIDATDLLPRDRTHYTYSGSLTTPPCSEGVAWSMMKQPVEVSKAQIARFQKIFAANARPVQALNGRGEGGSPHAVKAAMVSEEPHGGPDKGDGAPHWSYEGRIGPAYWGKLAREFALCDTGKNQSPVDIGKVFTAGGHKIKFNYKSVPLHVVNNGHTIQVNYPPGSSATIDRKTFALLQFHFHLPSEHTVKGKPYEMEAHLVHKNEHGDLAVVAVFIRGGKDNGLLKKLWRHLPTEAGEERELEDVTINAKDLLPRDRTHYVLSGSLTTPPCSEGVYWNLMKSPIRLSKGNIAKFGSIFSHNARPTQPLNNRLVVSMGGK